ncbi:MAG: GntR family transcriptional regulator [Synergistaceae bacterium]|nr:GntR family transcriptional regulator [Synergistaceae bacterium]
MKEQVEIAKEYILKSIITHRIPPSSVLYETVVANTLSMSRTPVRQALNDLVSIGLLEHTKGKRGYVLPELSCEDMLHVFDTRKCIEMLAVQEAAGLNYSYENTEIQIILSLVEEEKKMREAGNRFEYSLINRDIHFNFVKLSRNAYLTRIFLPVFWRTSLYDFSFSTFYREPFSSQTFFGGFDEHLNIVDAICKGDSLKAKECIDIHITPNVERFLRIYSDLQDSII